MTRPSSRPRPRASATGAQALNALYCARSFAGLTCGGARPADSPFRAPLCAARTLNAKGQSRATLSLQQDHLRAGCGPRQEERSLTCAQNDPRRLPRCRHASRCACALAAPLPAFACTLPRAASAVPIAAAAARRRGSAAARQSAYDLPDPHRHARKSCRTAASRTPARHTISTKILG